MSRGHGERCASFYSAVGRPDGWTVGVCVGRRPTPLVSSRSPPLCRARARLEASGSGGPCQDEIPATSCTSARRLVATRTRRRHRVASRSFTCAACFAPFAIVPSFCLGYHGGIDRSAGGGGGGHTSTGGGSPVPIHDTPTQDGTECWWRACHPDQRRLIRSRGSRACPRWRGGTPHSPVGRYDGSPDRPCRVDLVSLVNAS